MAGKASAGCRGDGEGRRAGSVANPGAHFSRWRRARAVRARVLLVVSLGFACGDLQALPTGNQTVVGTATVTTGSPTSMVITQGSQNAVINWQGFGIGNGESVVFNQPNAGSVALNRVLGSNPSQIYGNLSANGQVFLVNPNGILFGPTASVNVGGLVASTLGISDADFMAGKLGFGNGGTAGSIRNFGQLTASNGGYIALVAPDVGNAGTISAGNGGNVTLAAGNKVTLDFFGDNLLKVQVDEAALNAHIANSGAVMADGGQVVLSAQAAGDLTGSVINQSGVIRAKSLADRNGSIVLDGGGKGTVTVGGTLDASGSQSGTTGGSIGVFGQDIALQNASLDASGQTSGGTVLVGGDAHGAQAMVAGDVVANARTVSIDAASAIRADDTNQGNGGKVVVWSEGNTRFDGSISARGGATGGDGGFVETSGAQLKVGEQAAVSTLAAKGKSGTWLLDPVDFTIDASGVNMTGATLSSNLNGGNVAILSSNGTVGTEGNVNVNDAVSWSANTLTLNAQNNININSSMNGSGTASLALQYGQGAVAAGNTSSYNVNAPVTLPSGNNFSTQLGSDGGTLGYTVINSLGAAGSVTGTDLQGMNGNRAGLYALGANIDASGTSSWNGGLGFLPVGDGTNAFTGKFDGLGHTIAGLTIARDSTNTNYVGLFGAIGPGATVSNVGLVGGSIKGYMYVGGLVGQSNQGSINNSYATGDVSSVRRSIGGLVGYNYQGSISNSHASGNVTSALDYIGGLVGNDDGGTISNSYATGNVTGATHVGGLVGHEQTAVTITNAYATGSVTGTGGFQPAVGGLVGYFLGGTITNAFATGAVSGVSWTGGLVGVSGGTITNSYWNTETTGQATGGLSSTAVGKTTAQMMTAGALSFPGATWSIVDGASYPYLTALVTAPPQIVSGFAGATSGKTIQAVVSGANLASTGTGANGFYYFALPSGSAASGKTLLTYVAGNAVTGASAYGSTGADITGLDITASTLSAMGGSVSNSSLATARGSLTSTDMLYSASGNNLTASAAFQTAAAASYTLDGNLTSSGNQTYAGPVTLGQDTTLNAGTGAIAINGALAGAAHALTLTTTGAISQNAAISNVTTLSASGSSVTLNNGSNTIDTLGTISSSAGAINIADSAGGLTVTGNVTATGGALSLATTGAMTVNGTVSSSSDNMSLTASGGSGDLTLNSAIGWSTNKTLTLTAGNNIAVNANIAASGDTAGLVLAPTGSYALNNGTHIDLTGTAPSLSIAGAAYTVINSHSAGSGLGLEGSTTGSDLQGMNGNLAGKYALGSDIDASATSSWTGGFLPVGTAYETPFSGGFDGLGHAISGLSINRPTTDNIGLFGVYKSAAGTIANVGMLGGSIIGQLQTGGLVGWNDTGTVKNSYATGTVTGTQSVGGLVGYNGFDGPSLISNSYATGAVAGASYVGGLVGTNYSATVTTSWASGNVSVPSTYGVDIGGLIGHSYHGTVSKVYATGNVDGGSFAASQSAGGLIGLVTGFSLTDGYATGNVSGVTYVGGLVGKSTGTITTSYSTGAVSGTNQVGGLVGFNGMVVNNSFWDTQTSGQAASSGGTGRTTVQMLAQANYGGFDFTNTWYMVEGNTRPFLRMENTAAIGNAHQLQMMGMDLTRNYTLVRNIDMGELTRASGMWNSASGFVPVGSMTGTAFSGIFDGQGHTISGLTINRPTTSDSVGLFAYNTGTLKNVGLTGGSITGKDYVGALAGWSESGSISNAYATGTVSGGLQVGGLIGQATGSTVATSYATGAVTGSAKVGGLVGYIDGGSTISNSYATGAVISGGSFVGGLVGRVSASTVTNSFWDTTTSGRATSAGGTGMATADMKTQGNFTGATAANGMVNPNWNFTPTTGVWVMAAGGYPCLVGLPCAASSTPIYLRLITGSSVYGTTPVFTYGYYTDAAAGSTVADASPSGTVSWSGAPTALSGVNTYSLTYSSGITLGNSAYTLSAGNAVNWTVTKAPLTVTANADAKTYNGLAYSGGNGVTYSAFANGESSAVLGGALGYAGSSQGAINAGSYAITPNGLSSSNYSFSYVDGLLTVDKAPLTLAATAANKTYDGNATATVTGYGLAGFVGSETVLGASTGATFSDKNAGNGKTVTLTGISLNDGTNGGLAANYSVAASTTATADITAKAVTLTAPVVSKTYDGGLTYTTQAGDLTALSGQLVGSDTVSAATLAYTDKNAGTGNKTVNLNSATVSDGNGGANYTLTLAGNSASTIAKAALTLAAVTDSKTYDGTANSAGIVTVSGAAAGDSVTVGQQFDSRNASAANGRTLTVKSGYTIVDGGSADMSGNYSITDTATATGTITAKAVTLTAPVVGKTYDGGLTYTSQAGDLTALSGILVAGDTVTAATLAYTDKNAGTGNKTVNLNSATVSDGNGGNNYTLTLAGNSGSTINKAPLTLAATAADKVYDGNNSATVTGYGLAGFVGSETVIGDSTGATFSDKNAANGKTVAVTGISLNDGSNGGLASNYSVAASTTASADITPAALTASVTAADKVYDATTTATIAGRTVSGVIGGDSVSLTGGTASFADKDVGNGKLVTATGLGLTGSDAGNYTTNSSATTTASITPASLGVSLTAGITAANKVYDGTTAATITSRTVTGVVGGDDVSLTGGTATFDNKNVGTNKLVTATGLGLSGSAAGNYTANSTATTTADITPATLLASVTAAGKVYDATSAATLTGRTVSGVIAGDSVSLSGGTASFATKNVGTAKTVTATGLGLTGTDAGNYIANTTATTTADITPATLTASIAAADKVYDATTAATLSGGTLVGIAGTDAVILTLGSGAFSDKNVGTDKTVTVSGTAIGGADAGNYSLSAPASVTASITPRGLNVAADDKNKTVGSTDPVLTYQVSGEGLLGNDTLTGALTRAPGESAAPYAITQGSLANGNYAISFGNGVLTIAAAVTPPLVTPPPVVEPPPVVTPPVVVPPPVVVAPAPVTPSPFIVVPPVTPPAAVPVAAPALLSVSPLQEARGKDDDYLLESYPSYRIDMRKEAISSQTLTKSFLEVQSGGINVPRLERVASGH